MGAELGQVIAFTIEVALASTALILVPGMLVAWALARSFPGKAVVEALVSVPMVIPPTAIGLMLLVVLGPVSPMGAWLAQHVKWDIAFTWRAVMLACAVVSFPLFVRQAKAALEEVDPEVLGVARTLGRGPVACFFEVHAPLAWRGILAGLVLAFTRALGEFGATIVVAGNIPGQTQTLALALFQQIQVGREKDALVLAGISTAIAVVALACVELLSRNRERLLSQ